MTSEDESWHIAEGLKGKAGAVRTGGINSRLVRSD